MDMEAIKNRILEIHAVWDVLDEDLDGERYGEIHKSFVIEIISAYCIGKGYEVEGFPMQKRVLAMANNTYNEDYFCYERYIKYLDTLATRYEDVFELMFFYMATFWPEQFETRDAYRDRLLDCVSSGVYEIEF